MKPKRRAERTVFNTDYMPWLEEDELPGDDPQDVEHRTVKSMDIVLADEMRFRRLCRQYGWKYPSSKRKSNKK